MLWLSHHNSEINWRTGEVKMMRYPEECGKQWRPKQEKAEWQKQKKEERKKEAERKQEEKQKKEKKKPKKESRIKVRRVVEEWEIWDKNEEVAKLKAEARKLVPEKFYM